MFKAIFLLLITIIVTYFAKFHTYTVEPVRVHENLGWILPLKRDLSFLFVSGDDNNDRNALKTGYRIWFNPPKEPFLLSKGEKATFVGPSITVIGDSLDLETIAQISISINDGGSMHIIGKQILPYELIKQQNPRVTFSIEELYNKTISLPMGIDIQNSFTFDSTGRYSATIKNNLYTYVITNSNSIEPILDSSNNESSMVNINLLNQSKIAVPHFEESFQGTVLFRNTQDTVSSKDSTRINVYEPDRAAVFYEDKNFGENRLLIRKIHLLSWRGHGQ